MINCDKISEFGEEGFFIDRENSTYNLDKWKPGNNNVLLITGLSGSGKSTLTNELAKTHNASIFSIDLFKYNSDLFNNDNIDKGSMIIKNYIISNYGGPKNFNRFGDAGYDKEQSKFLSYLLNYAKIHNNELFIIEGIQLVKINNYLLNDLNNRPCIVMGTSMVTSIIRRINRDKFEDHNGVLGTKFKSFKELVFWYTKYERMLKNYTKNINCNCK